MTSIGRCGTSRERLLGVTGSQFTSEGLGGWSRPLEDAESLLNLGFDEMRAEPS